MLLFALGLCLLGLCLLGLCFSEKGGILNESMLPEGLNQRQLARLEEHVRRGQLMTPEQLLQAAYAHLEDVQSAHTTQPTVDTRLAEAICQLFARVVSEWDAFSPAQQSWLRGAMRYFSKSDDDLPDFLPGGLEDDREVLNACLRFAERDDWTLPPAAGGG